VPPLPTTVPLLDAPLLDDAPVLPDALPPIPPLLVLVDAAPLLVDAPLLVAVGPVPEDDVAPPDPPGFDPHPVSVPSSTSAGPTFHGSTPRTLASLIGSP
jgi:hypothetical protein